MFKITIFVSLMLIGTVWAAGISCDSCGSECTSACGTKHFRSCCFNYLRKKRGPDTLKYWSPSHDFKTRPEASSKPKMAAFALESIPDAWLSNLVLGEIEPYPIDDTVENRLQLFYDA